MAFPIPPEFGGIAGLMERFKAAAGRREQWRSLQQECYDYALPQKETFTEHAPGQKKNIHIYDSTAVHGVQQFSSRVQSSLTPPWMEWMVLAAGSNTAEEDKEKTNKLLEKITKIFFDHLNHSNFSNQVNESNLDLSVGTGALMLEEGDESKGEPLLKFTSIPLAQLYLEPTNGARVENFWRKHRVQARLLPALWPAGDFGPKLDKIIEKKPNQEEEILDGVLKEIKTGTHWQVVIHESSKQIIFAQSLDVSPGIIYRWSVTPGETYGRGPVMQALPDIRTANKVKEFTLKNAAIQMSGTYTGVSDGIFNPHTARIAPGVIMPVASNASANPSIAPLTPSGNLGISELLLGELQESIRKALFADPLGSLDDPSKTATEILIRNQEMLRNAGASFGRLKTELLEPLVARVVEILLRNGKIPPIKVDGKDVTIRMQSPLAKAENMEDFNNSQIWFGMVSQLPPEVQLLSVQIERLPTYWADKLGVPAELVRDKEEIDEAKKQIEAMAQQQLEGGQVDGQQPQ